MFVPPCSPIEDAASCAGGVSDDMTARLVRTVFEASRDVDLPTKSLITICLTTLGFIESGGDPQTAADMLTRHTASRLPLDVECVSALDASDAWIRRASVDANMRWPSGVAEAHQQFVMLVASRLAGDPRPLSTCGLGTEGDMLVVRWGLAHMIRMEIEDLGKASQVVYCVLNHDLSEWDDENGKIIRSRGRKL